MPVPLTRAAMAVMPTLGIVAAAMPGRQAAGSGRLQRIGDAPGRPQRTEFWTGPAATVDMGTAAAWTDLDDDVAELLRLAEAAQGVDGNFPGLAGGGGRRAELPGGHVQVLAAGWRPPRRRH